MRCLRLTSRNSLLIDHSVRTLPLSSRAVDDLRLAAPIFAHLHLSDVIRVSDIGISSLPLALEVEHLVTILFVQYGGKLLNLSPHLWKVLLRPGLHILLVPTARNDIVKDSKPTL